MTSKQIEDPAVYDHDDPDAQMEAIDADIMQLTSHQHHQQQPRVRLTMALIRQNAMAIARDSHEDEDVDALLSRKILRLDWLNIVAIENLEAFSHAEELYLQHNCIERIENLDDMVHLRFLALHNNRISTVENLRHLSNLQFLDLSNNDIRDIELDAFPPSLMILRLAGNPFLRHMPQYVTMFFEKFPSLVQIDHFRRVAEETDAAEPSRITKSSSLYSPKSRYTEMQVDAEAMWHSRFQTTKPPANETLEDDEEDDTSFDVERYKRERLERMGRLKEVAFARQNLNVDMPKDFQAKRDRVLQSARSATEEAIAASRAHFEAMEEQHRQWQQDHQQPS